MAIASVKANPDLILDPASVKLWNVQEYHRLYDLGLIGVNERCELIAGQISLMSPKGTLHVVALQLLADLLRSQIRDDVSIRTQDPIQLDDLSEPEPDLAIVRGTILDYIDRHPASADILLLVEVADSTLKTDSEIKDKLYAQANIAEYWVLDLPHRQLIVFRNPTTTGYSDRSILVAGSSILPLAFPDVAVSIDLILPPA